jgi:hypothetical protein
MCEKGAIALACRLVSPAVAPASACVRSLVQALAWVRVPAWACCLGAWRPVGPGVRARLSLGLAAFGWAGFGKRWRFAFAVNPTRLERSDLVRVYALMWACSLVCREARLK